MSLYVDTGAEALKEFNGCESVPLKSDFDTTRNRIENIKNLNESKNEVTDIFSVKKKLRYGEVVVKDQVCQAENNDANMKYLVFIMKDAFKNFTMEMGKHFKAQEEKNISIATRLHHLENSKLVSCSFQVNALTYLISLFALLKATFYVCLDSAGP